MAVTKVPQRTDNRTDDTALVYSGDPSHEQCECGSRESVVPAMRLLNNRRMFDALISSLEIETWEPDEFLQAFRIDEPAHVVIEDGWRADWVDLGQTLGCVIEQTYETFPTETKLLINSQMRLMHDE